MEELTSLDAKRLELRAQAFDKSRPVLKAEFYHSEPDGIYLVNEHKNESQWVCSPLEVVAHARSHGSTNWGKLIRLKNLDQRTHELIIPAHLCVGDGDELIRVLTSHGLRLPGGRTAMKHVLKYVADSNPAKRVVSVDRIGWHGDTFVLPGKSFGAGSESIHFQEGADGESSFQVSGTLADWQQNVGALCQGNSRLVMAVSAAFAPPLLKLLGEESGGFHFTGSSSSGKTTSLRVAGSVWGGGTRPYIRLWRATSNGLEAVAEAHNDALLCLDELAQVSPWEAGEIAYMLANGSGKVRSTKSGGAKKRAQWNLLFLSTGEISLSEHMRQSGKVTKAGQDVRMADIPLPKDSHGAFEAIHQFQNASQFAEALSKNSRSNYGTPIHHYLEGVLDQLESIRQTVIEARTAFMAQYCPDECNGQVKRVAQRFALVAAAGSLATHMKITGWPDQEAFRGVGKCFSDWLNHRGTLGDADELTAVAQFRAFFEAHGESRFVLLGKSAAGDTIRSEDRTVHNKAGYRRINSSGAITQWMVQSEAFKEICKGHSPSWVCDLLTRHELLIRGSDGKSSRSEYIPDLGKTIRVYCIDAKILEVTK